MEMSQRGNNTTNENEKCVIIRILKDWKAN